MKNKIAILLVLLMGTHAFADQVSFLKEGSGLGKLILKQDVIFEKHNFKAGSYDTYNLIGESELVRFEISPVTMSGVVAVFRSKAAQGMEFRLLLVDKEVRGMVPVPYLNQNISSLQITVEKCKALRTSFKVDSSIDAHIGQCAIDLQQLKMKPK